MTKRGNSVADMPLFVWGEALRARKARRRTQVRRGVALGLGVVTLGVTVVLPPAPRLVWNASASAPIGLYAVGPGATPRRGDTVIARVPARFRLLAATRRYLPLNVPLVKHVVGSQGDEICALGDHLFVNGSPAAARKLRDGRGRSLPWWNGCRRLRAGQLFLLMTASPDSFDGRYFGPTDPADVVGTARLLWARP